MNVFQSNTKLYLFSSTPSLVGTTMSHFGYLNSYPIAWWQWSYPLSDLTILSCLFLLSVVFGSHEQINNIDDSDKALTSRQGLHVFGSWKPEFFEKVTVVSLQNLIAQFCCPFYSAEVYGKMIYILRTQELKPMY